MAAQCYPGAGPTLSRRDVRRAKENQDRGELQEKLFSKKRRHTWVSERTVRLHKEQSATFE
jgi:hypothetical protein